MGFKLFFFRKKLQVLSFLLFIGLYVKVWVYSELISQAFPLQYRFVIFARFVGAVQLNVRTFFFLGKLFHIPVDLVCSWEEVISRSCYLVILNQDPDIYFIVKINIAL